MNTRTMLGGSAAAIFAGPLRWRPVANAPNEGIAGLATRIETNHTEVKASLEKSLAGVNDLTARVTEMEQKAAMGHFGGGGGGDLHRTPGRILVESDEFKAAAALGARWRGQVSIEVKTITSGTVSAGSMIAPDVSTTPVMLPKRRLRVRDLVSPGRTSSNAIWWPRQTSRTNAAATVAENPSAAKPQSDLAFALNQSNVTTLATWIKASKQVMDDAPMLSSIVDDELRYMLADIEDRQLLSGDGTGTNLLGILPQATAFAVPAGMRAITNPTMIDVLLQAMAQAEMSDYQMSGIVMHPVDYWSLLALKDAQNRYLAAGPMAPLLEALWSTPIVRTRVMAQGTFLLGAFKDAAQIFDRQDANVLVSTEDQDNFVKNMVTVLAEERLAFVVKQPAAFITGSLTPAS